jgi:AraC-like DNA-binding protein
MVLDVNSINPFLRYVHFIELVPEYTTHLQIAYDHRIFFCLNGDYTITANDIPYAMGENSLLYVPSGTPYHLHRPSKNILLVGINFDWTCEKSNLSTPIAPVFNPKSFNLDTVLENFNFSDVKEFNAPFILSNQHFLLKTVREMLDEYTTKRLFYQSVCNSLLKNMITNIARTAITGASPSPKNTVDLVIRYIQENYKQNISNEDIGKALNFHPNYLNKLMVLNTGKTLHRYLLSYRLLKALDLLQSSDMTVTEIAEETGFTDVQQFCKFFLAQTGSTPTSFR